MLRLEEGCTDGCRQGPLAVWPESQQAANRRGSAGANSTVSKSDTSGCMYGCIYATRPSSKWGPASKQTDRQTGRQTARHTNRQTDKQSAKRDASSGQGDLDRDGGKK